MRSWKGRDSSSLTFRVAIVNGSDYIGFQIVGKDLTPVEFMNEMNALKSTCS